MKNAMTGAGGEEAKARVTWLVDEPDSVRPDHCARFPVG
jgi:hypothetical protein